MYCACIIVMFGIQTKMHSNAVTVMNCGGYDQVVQSVPMAPISAN